MDNSMNDLMDLFSLICGAYCLYTWLKLITGKKLFQNSLLMPKDKKPEECLNEEEYIAYIRPRIGIVAFAVLIATALTRINMQMETPILEFPWTMVLWAVELGVLIWFGVCSARAIRRYF